MGIESITGMCLRGRGPLMLQTTVGDEFVGRIGMTTGGRGIPRLQELSYLEVAARAVDKGSSFEEIRREMVEHMLAISEASPGTGKHGSLQER